MTKTTTTKFCFDRSWSGGLSADRDAIEAILEDMVEGDYGTGHIEGDGDNTTVIIEGTFDGDHLQKISSQLADWGMRQELCE